MLASTFAAALLGPALSLLILGVLALFLERKLIGIAQKRLGISFLGRNGWAHLPADLIKFWLKHTARHHGSWLTAAGGVAGALLGYLSWSLISAVFFLTDRGGAVADFWEFQLLAYFGYANLTTLFMYGLVAGTKSKYATLAATRLLLVGTFLEVFFMASFLFTYAHVGGYGFAEVAEAARLGGGAALALPPLGLFFLLYALFEAKRAPFDHSEAESELVAGHMVEYGGRALLFFYLCEYAHMIFCLFLLLTFVGGGSGFPAWAALWPYWADSALAGLVAC